MGEVYGKETTAQSSHLKKKKKRVEGLGEYHTAQLRWSPLCQVLRVWNLCGRQLEIGKKDLPNESIVYKFRALL